ncbi:transcriptional regulator [Sphingobacterium faecium NBRC 15299]|uniref:TetR/AcrR family transcriptional regulator n=1 Tax=Sphingobacterium faecium TaxID=34087 RepID=UPI000D36F3A6|nr:TetR/AcrR family transcriptional regulator [Sphingobacterium faecium]PTX10849.1 TetR family transcriptional regulator [Sphingobacterium faecium]GEM62726.1 transcriptional regulator [Sphingobacterium faecium NBRC 15299]
MARKTYQGEKNDKSRTMNKLIQSVGIVLEKKGYTGLTIANIASTAGVDRKLISVYFGSVENLIETYIKGKDYWVEATAAAEQTLANSKDESTRHFLENLLLEQIHYFALNEEMQKVVLWQISEKSDIMSHVTQSREKMSSLFFPYSDKELAGKNVDLRAVSSLLVAGIYYLVLHTKMTDSTFCEIDLTTEEGMNRIKEAVKFILKQTYGAE